MNTNNENIRTMEYVGLDDWSNPTYKCIEDGCLWKDISLGSENPDLYTCGNDFDGEPGFPIRKDIKIVYKSQYQKSPYKFNYMMLDRLRSDCEYYLGNGERVSSTLYYKDEKEHIEEMKKLYNSFPDGEKPEWLTLDDILKYEKLMVFEG